MNRRNDWEGKMKKILAASIVLTCAAAFAGRPKYVFVFIGDGMSTPQRMVAEEFAGKVGHGELAMNRLPYQANTRTKSANAVITDSAAAGTAIASAIFARMAGICGASFGRWASTVQSALHSS